jgi:hypothetical protein
VVLDGIELVEDHDGNQSLRLRRNGEPKRWSLDHLFEEYPATLAILEKIVDLEPAVTIHARSTRLTISAPTYCCSMPR